MSNSILIDARELKIDELEMVSGGSSFAQEVVHTALLGALGVAFVGSIAQVVHDAANAAKNSCK